MDETVSSSTAQRRVSRHHEREFFTAIQRGRDLAADLDKAVLKLHQRFPHSILILEDQTGWPVRTFGNDEEVKRTGDEWKRVPLLFNNHQFGCIRYMGAVGKLSNMDVIEIVLSLIEIEHWAEVESERRGEKVQRLLSEGVTESVTRLLSLCGLVESCGYILVAMELSTKADKFLHMDELRKFMLARLWRYESTMDFIAFRQGGLIGIFPGELEDRKKWEETVEDCIVQWNHYQERQSSPLAMEVHACVSFVESLHQLDNGIRRIDATLQLADKWNLSGLIRPRFSRTLTTDMLCNLADRQILEMVEGTLGALRAAENEELLQTLRIYLLFNQNAAQTARALYIHRNTLLYRIKNIEEILGLNLRNTAQLSAVWFALEGLEFLESSGLGKNLNGKDAQRQ
ncbi:CdaR family transcriptional regulator [Alicyclobacillus sp. SO9]|uniref:PucR family transcriptional regulator n=1 Tax=Alicyclobacillus sp. SO9 TaxID=2665646 RepID=UPI0018E8E2BC|nr:helix-turn-helix domain-containing protein [Alicyclobacillus sp. SO9]QQE80650.1 helix-turn-helix domain-containing protein [Alicyclobacillus sp. SO9]